MGIGVDVLRSDAYLPWIFVFYAKTRLGAVSTIMPKPVFAALSAS